MADEHHEIVIIHRGGHSDHDDHHGGVWKIAFADFMTAMMAFFLVMWLLSVNDKAKTAIVRYFNPIKLVDATVHKKGLHEPKPEDKPNIGPNGSNTTRTVKSDEAKPTGNSSGGSKGKDHEAQLDAALRSNPFAALAEIAGSGSPGEGSQHEAPAARAPVIGRQGGQAFRDPFAPPPPQVAHADDKDDDLLTITPPRQAVAAATPKSVDRKAVPAPSADIKPAPEPTAAASTVAMSTPAAPPNPEAVSTPKVDRATAKGDQDLTKQLMASLTGNKAEPGAPNVKVRRTGEGVLVSLTDTDNFSMFTSGSAVPSRRVVLMMEHIAKVLASRPGRIIIRGYTDNKPFKGTGRYDNWSLSVDRAQSAHYMLVRGGLGDDRIASVEGFADRGPVPGLDPSSPLNRRIEILIQDPAK